MTFKVPRTRDAEVGVEPLFDIEDASTVSVLAVRHQLEDDYH